MKILVLFSLLISQNIYANLSAKLKLETLMIAINSMDETKIYEMISPTLKKNLMIHSFRALLRDIHSNCGRIKSFGSFEVKNNIYEYSPDFTKSPCRIDISFDSDKKISYFIIQKVGPQSKNK